jgi:hypothetical protein
MANSMGKQAFPQFRPSESTVSGKGRQNRSVSDSRLFATDKASFGFKPKPKRSSPTPHPQSPSGCLFGHHEPRVDQDLTVVVRGHFGVGQDGEKDSDQFFQGRHEAGSFFFGWDSEKETLTQETEGVPFALPANQAGSSQVNEITDEGQP